MESFDISTLEKLRSAVNNLVSQFSSRQLVLLEGPLGSGKTQTVRYIVEELGGGEICSPSFAIHNIYETPKGDIDHIDLYRLDDDDDIASTGFWDIFEKDEGLVLIEWSNYLAKNEVPTYWDQITLKIDVSDSGERQLNALDVPKK